MSRRTPTTNKVLGDVLLNVADALSDGLWSIDQDGCVTYANAALARLLRVSKEQLIGHSAFDFVFDADQELAHKLLEAIKDGQVLNVDFRLRASDGSPVWAHCKSSPMVDDEGGFAGVVAIIRQIVTPEEIAESPSLAMAIVNSPDDPIV